MTCATTIGICLALLPAAWFIEITLALGVQVLQQLNAQLNVQNAAGLSTNARGAYG